MSFLDILKAVVVVGEEVVPIFVHNPNSQKIEAVVITTVNHALGLNSSKITSTPKPVPVPAPTTSKPTVQTHTTPPPKK